MSLPEGDRPLPLDGIVVLDLGQIYQGPYAGFLLAMAGARVIKVEQRGGEPLRGRGKSLPFAMLNSSKEAVTVDLKTTDGVALLKRLVSAADVVLVNYAAGVPERLGISYADLEPHNEKLVYAHASGFGLDGETSVPAMDVTVQAHTGAMSVNGFADHGPVRAGIAYIDFLGGTHLYGAITTALFEAERTGRGRSVEISMAEAAYMPLATNLGGWYQNGETPRRGNRHPSLGVAPYDVYACADGHVALIAVTNRHWRSILEVLGRNDLIDDPRYRSNDDRVERMDDVDRLIADWASSRSRDEVAKALQGARVPAAAVRIIDEVVRDEAQHRRGALQWVDHPELGEVPLPHSPIRWHGSELRPIESSPALGADNAAVYGELASMTEADIADLERREVI
ncbi:MAG: CaiB/BaiF CoA transferase family protein [Acidimicrobiales bacterium]